MATYVLYGAANCSRVTADVSHVADEGPHYLHEDIRPNLVVNVLGVARFGNGLIQRSKNLAIEYFFWNGRKVDNDLEDLLEVIPTWNALL